MNEITEQNQFNLSQMVDTVYGLACEKGWHNGNETEDEFLERCTNNLHDEVSELHEAWRNNKLHDLCDKADSMVHAGLEPLTCIEEEFADIIIRVFDNCKQLGVNIGRAVAIKHAFNATRSIRHGGKRS